MLREIGSAFVGENQNRGTEFSPFKPIENQAITNRLLTTLAEYATFAETFSLYYFFIVHIREIPRTPINKGIVL